MAEVIIIGGGIIGSSIAYKLVQQEINVVLIAPIENVGIASTAAGGMLGAFGEITHDKTSLLDDYELDFRVKSQKLYSSWIEELEEQSGVLIFRNSGTFIIGNHAGKDDYENLQLIKKKLKQYNEAFEIVQPQYIPNYKPNPKYVSNESIFIPNEGSVSSTQLLTALKTFLDNSVYYKEINQKVMSIEIDSKKFVQTDSGEKFEAEKIILCAGVGVQTLVDEYKINIPQLFPGKGTSLLMESNEIMENVIRTPNRDFACGTHIVPRENNQIYLGATNRISETPGIDGGATAGEINSILHSVLNEINTDFRTRNIVKTNYGSRPLTEDRYPVIGETNVKNLYVATGTYRNGILMAPLISDIIWDELTGKKAEFENKFSPANRNLYIKEEPKNKVIEMGVRDLISFIQEPTGELPYNRQEELFNFISTLMKMTYTNEREYQELKSDSEAMLDINMSEVIPQLFYKFQKNQVT